MRLNSREKLTIASSGVVVALTLAIAARKASQGTFDGWSATVGFLSVLAIFFTLRAAAVRETKR
jgi:hypothetical protein